MDVEATGGSGLNALKNVLKDTFGKKAMKQMIQPMAKAYQTVNAQIDRNLDLMKQEVEANKEAYKQSKQTVKDLEEQKKAADSQMNMFRNSIRSSTYIDPISSQDFDNGDIVDASKFGSASASVQGDLAWYNQYAAQSKQLEYALKEAKEKMDEQYNETQQSAAKYAGAIVQSVFDKMENIEAHYSSIVDWQEAVIDHLKANRDYMIEWEGYIGNTKEIGKTYTKEMTRYGNELGAVT